jgi:hypothetical protein
MTDDIKAGVDRWNKCVLEGKNPEPGKRGRPKGAAKKFDMDDVRIDCRISQ